MTRSAVASGPQGRETCSDTSRPVKTFNAAGDVCVKRSPLQGFLSTVMKLFSHCSAARSAREPEVDSALIYSLFFNHIYVQTCRLKSYSVCYFFAISFFSNDEMNIIQR